MCLYFYGSFLPGKYGNRAITIVDKAFIIVHALQSGLMAFSLILVLTFQDFCYTKSAIARNMNTRILLPRKEHM